MGGEETIDAPVRYPMPLLRSSFEKGGLAAAVDAVGNPDLRRIA